jgi:predicted DNA-binding protein YlxM (UPF0122 family)
MRTVPNPDGTQAVPPENKFKSTVAIDGAVVATLAAMAADSAWSANDAARRARNRINQREKKISKGTASALEREFLDTDREMARRGATHTRDGLRAIRTACVTLGIDEARLGLTEDRFGDAIHEVPALSPDDGEGPNAEQCLAMLIAMHVRNAMEDFHVEHLSDSQMAELNPIIRNAIYDMLWAMSDRVEKSAVERKVAAELINFQRMLLPNYWEQPQLTEEVIELVTRYAQEAQEATTLNSETQP